MDSFTRAYIECALRSSTDNSRDDGGDPLDANFSIDDISPGTLASMINECADFQEHYHHLYAEKWSAEEAGHDFWLTRNRHRAGFWDRTSHAIGKTLTDFAHVYGSVDLYVGDDGLIYSN